MRTGPSAAPYDRQMLFGRTPDQARPPGRPDPATPRGVATPRGDATPLGDALPRGMRIAGAWSWRIVVIAAAAAIGIWLVMQFSLIVIPVLVAALLTALLQPLVDVLVRHRWPRGLAVAVAIVGLIVLVSGLGWLVVSQMRSEYPELQARAVAFWGDAQGWLLSLPFGITQEDVNEFGTNILGTLRDDISSVLSSALTVGSSVGHFLAGMLLAIFALIFILADGRGIWRWVVGLLPRPARRPTDGAGRAGWVTLGNFVRVQVVVAAIDAIGIGLGAFILGLFHEGGMPLVLPIAILVFLGSFIPIIGAVATGAIAVLVALIALGPIPAVIMVGIVLLVQQVESHILQPIIMGTAVKVHPLAVVVAVAAGSTIGGIAGALFAVPTVAFLNVFVKTIASGSWRTNPDPSVQEVVR
ncbi:putative PurR-regulated permease PerM [Agrococcus jenensis]|uniref:Putative PurR-regulated permease PerM n=2 Tax=Agrococcus jenensis TaxID=46353 RepID=A0A3N2AP60_9MICO|nr:putative PurR-regulated permease PerM [Agrococcus jenensis]